MLDKNQTFTNHIHDALKILFTSFHFIKDFCMSIWGLISTQLHVIDLD